MNQPYNIPAAHQHLIEAAIRAANLGDVWTVKAGLGGGLSTSVLYPLVVEGRHYVARITDPDDPHNNLAHEYAVMHAVNQLGIAPHLYYADASAGIAISDFVAGQPLFPWQEDRPPLPHLLADAVRTLHDSPALPKSHSIFEKAQTIFGWLPEPFRQQSLVAEAGTRMNEFATLIHDPAYLRPGHGDLNPGNLLFDGARLWLIDWAAAGQENYYFDLACCTNFFFHASAAAEMAFLQRYFTRRPTAEEMAIYHRMRIFCAIYYGLMFLYMSSATGTPLLPATEIDQLPTHAAFMQLVGRGQVRLDQPQEQQRLGFIYLQQIAGMATVQ